MLFVFALAAVASLIVFAWAWRGRRTDLHPCCRGCGFDLVGSGEAPTQCPECGLRLSHPRAVRVGNRERRYRVLTTSGVFLVGLAAFGGVTAWRAGSHASFMGILPESALRLIYHVDPLARVELLKRLNHHNLDADTVSAFIASALDIQGDASRPWDITWGRFVEAAAAQGTLSAADGERYLKQAIAFSLDIRPQIQRGRIPRMDAKFERQRCGDLRIRVTSRWDAITVNGQPLPLGRHQNASSTHRNSPTGFSRVGNSIEIASLGDTLGRFTVGATVSVKIEQDGQRGATPHPMSVNGVKRAATQTIEVVALPTAAYADDPADNQRLARDSYVTIGTLPTQSGKGAPQLMIIQLNRDTDLVWPDWKIDTGRGLIPLSGTNFSSTREGTGSNPTGQPQTVHAWAWHLDAIAPNGTPLPERFDLVLKTDIDTAETSTNLRPHWLGTLRFNQVSRDTPPIDLSYFDAPLPLRSNTMPSIVPAVAIPTTKPMP